MAAPSHPGSDMAVDIAPAEPADIEAIQRVAERAWTEAHAPIIGTETVEEFLDEYYDRASFEARIADEEAILPVASDPEDDVVGYAFARAVDDDGATYNLGQIYVAPVWWGEGVGSALLADAERTIAERGGDRVRLGVMAENDRAVDFYEAAGYSRVDEFYDERIDATGYSYAKELG